MLVVAVAEQIILAQQVPVVMAVVAQVGHPEQVPQEQPTPVAVAVAQVVHLVPQAVAQVVLVW